MTAGASTRRPLRVLPARCVISVLTKLPLAAAASRSSAGSDTASDTGRYTRTRRGR